MNRTITAGVCLFAISLFAVTAARGSAYSQGVVASFDDGTQPPVPPVPMGGPGQIVAWAIDGTQPPVPPVPMGGG